MSSGWKNLFFIFLSILLTILVTFLYWKLSLQRGKYRDCFCSWILCPACYWYCYSIGNFVVADRDYSTNA